MVCSAPNSGPRIRANVNYYYIYCDLMRATLTDLGSLAALANADVATLVSLATTLPTGWHYVTRTHAQKCARAHVSNVTGLYTFPSGGVMQIGEPLVVYRAGAPISPFVSLLAKASENIFFIFSRQSYLCVFTHDLSKIKVTKGVTTGAKNMCLSVAANATSAGDKKRNNGA